MPGNLKFETAVKIGPATVGIRSNAVELLPVLPPKIEVKSLLTDFHSIRKIPYTEDLDAYIHISDNGTKQPQPII